MTHRERLMAAVRGEPSDRIPWAPRMDLWYIAHRGRCTVPEPFADANTVEISKVLDVACHVVGADFTLSGGRDSSLRGLGIDNHQDYPYRVQLKGLPVDSQNDGEDLRTRIQTSSGEIFTHLHTDRQMQMAGISLPFVKSYALESPEDYDALACVFDHLEVIPTPNAYEAFDRRVGDRGIAVARGPMVASPIHLMLHELMPMDRFFYAYADDRDRLYGLAERMTPFFDASLNALLESSAEVIFWGANYDQDLTWPPFFEREIAPWLKKVADRAHAAGKLLLTHADGENKDLLSLYPPCDFDVAESVCPAPMTQCTLAELREGFGSKTTVWGGIPSVALLPEVMDEPAFKSYIDEVFSNLGAGERLILGVSDNVPPNADLDRLSHITKCVEAFGPVSPAVGSP